jgi:hypothetical protein
MKEDHDFNLTLSAIKRSFYARAQNVAEVALNMERSSPGSRLALYYRPTSEDGSGDVGVSFHDVPPAGMIKVEGVLDVVRTLTLEEIAYRIQTAMWGLPILPLSLEALEPGSGFSAPSKEFRVFISKEPVSEITDENIGEIEWVRLYGVISLRGEDEDEELIVEAIPEHRFGFHAFCGAAENPDPVTYAFAYETGEGEEGEAITAYVGGPEVVPAYESNCGFAVTRFIIYPAQPPVEIRCDELVRADGMPDPA